jgi:protein-ribulosamine 3-kinase
MTAALSTSTIDAIARAVTSATGTSLGTARASPLGGGSINAAFRLESALAPYFVKINSAARLSMFEAEAAGLREIANSHSVRVPLPVCCGVAGDHAYLVLEYLELGRCDAHCARALGHGLAALHRTTSEYFGWSRDNTIGSTPQINTLSADWLEFWCERRLGFQLRLARENGYAGDLQRDGERLAARCGALFADYAPRPSLLHGDLWGGNYGATAQGEPVIFDPAVYYGDREADLAMTELFGGFPRQFHDAYNEAWPLDAGYPVRKDFYNLYHVLNHLNLFGDAYLGQARSLMRRLLAHL